MMLISPDIVNMDDIEDKYSRIEPNSVKNFLFGGTLLGRYKASRTDCV